MARILALDDDPDILAIIEAALQLAGHRIVPSSSPGEAVELAIENAVDAVILDVNMPGLSGFDVLADLRAHPETKGLPVLFLSALTDSKQRIRGLREGADDYLGKPFETEELVLRIERLARRRHQADSTSPVDASEELKRALISGELEQPIPLGRYQALEVVGKGAMGIVLRGWDPQLKRPVALKTLQPERFVSERDMGRALEDLLDEAALLARFNHPNIVIVYDIARTPQIGFMVMELVDGTSLQELLRVDTPPLHQAVDVGIAIARALEAAHSAGLVHRDIKPGNILLGKDGSIKVSDFGVADLAQSMVSKAPQIFGTPGFVPPESLRGEGHGAPGDVFSLGAVLYYTLLGFPAFDGSTAVKLLASTLTETVSSPAKIDPRIPRSFSRLVSHMLSKNPEERPTAAEVAHQLSKLEIDRPTANPRSLMFTANPFAPVVAPR